MSSLAVFLIFVGGGVAGGVLLGMVGVGMALVGVPVLVLTLPLTGVRPDDAPLVALATSMGIVTMGSVSSVWSHHRRGNIDWGLFRSLSPFSVAGLLLGSLVASRYVSPQGLRWMLCGIELYIAWTMLRPKRPGPPPQAHAPGHQRGVAALIGVSGSLIGAGGGVFLVPYLARQGLAMKQAVATSVTIGLPVTIAGTIYYLGQPAPPEPGGMAGMVHLPALLGLGFGSMAGAPLGVSIASRMDGNILKKAFGVMLIVLAINVAFS